MTNVLVLSPHLDDAAFSVGPLLAELSKHASIVVATAFTKSESKLSQFALACQLDKGLSAEVDYMAIRRKEDIEWSRRISAQAVHGAFAEAPHRGYQSAQELFGPVLATDKLGDALKVWFSDLVQTFKPTTVLCPIAIGNHVDHQWVREIATASLDAKFPLFFFKDQPYAAKLNPFQVENYLGCVRAWCESNVSFSKSSLLTALFSAEAYQTQIPFQFGHTDKMRHTLREAWGLNLSLFHSDVIPLSDTMFSPFAIERLCQD